MNEALTLPGAPAIPGLSFRRYRDDEDIPAMVEVANRHSEGRVLSVLEGGYHPVALPQSVAFHIRELLA